MLLSDWRKQNSPLHCRAGLSFSTSGASLTNYSFIPFIPVQPKHHCSSKSSREKTQQVLRLLSGFNCSCCLTEQGVCHITRVTMMRNQRQLGKYPGAVVVEEVLQLCPVPEREPNSPSTQRLLLLDRQGPNCPCFTAPRRTPNFTFKQQNSPGMERAHHSGSHTQAFILLSLQTHTPNRPSLPHWLPMHFLAINIWVFYLG